MSHTVGSNHIEEKPSSEETQQPRMRADARRNRNEILMAARDMFAAHGASTPLEAIAQQAHVGIGTLYRHFSDRQSLLRAVALDVFERVAEEARRALAEEQEAFEALARYMHRALDLRVGVVMPVLFNQLSMDDREVNRARDELTGLIQTIIDNAKQAGALRSDVAFGDIGVLIIRLANPLADVIPTEVSNRLSHRHLDIVLDGLRAPSSQRRNPLTEPALTLQDLHGFTADVQSNAE